MILNRLRKPLSLVVPQGPGKLIYLFTYTVLALQSKRKFNQIIRLWYRNSLLQNYFAFALSDIDLSVELAGNEHLSDTSKGIEASLKRCPLIKEINFYYPFSLQMLPVVANYFEVSKDPELLKKIKLQKSADSFVEAQKITYLLRMLFSNLNQFKYQFGSREIKKWSFHFNLVEIENLTSKLSEINNAKDLLLLICSAFPLLAVSSTETLSAVLEAVNFKKPLHKLLEESSVPGDLLSLMPQFFCFSQLPINCSSLFKEEIFVEQIAWEIQGMLSQPTIFYTNSPAFQHLHNIELLLTRNTLSDTNCEKRKCEILKILKEYRGLLCGRGLVFSEL